MSTTSTTVRPIAPDPERAARARGRAEVVRSRAVDMIIHSVATMPNCGIHEQISPKPGLWAVC